MGGGGSNYLCRPIIKNAEKPVMFSSYVHLHMLEFVSLVVLSATVIINVIIKSNVSMLLVMFTSGLWLQYISNVYTSRAPMTTTILTYLGFFLEVAASIMVLRLVSKMRTLGKAKTPPNSV